MVIERRQGDEKDQRDYVGDHPDRSDQPCQFWNVPFPKDHQFESLPPYAIEYPGFYKVENATEGLSRSN
jgi:hypothetical protein